VSVGALWDAKPPRRQLEAEVDRRLELAGGGELAHERWAELLVEHLAEGEEVVDAPSLGSGQDVGPELLPARRWCWPIMTGVRAWTR
jgi:hypothetical protein